MSGSAPLTVLYKDTSTGTPTAWKWEFGDGYTSTRKTPYHIYKNDGSYTVKLTVSNAEGTDTETKYAYINVGNSIESPNAAFSADFTEGKAPIKVSFADESTGTPTAWKWEFGDGYTSNLQNPEHIYEKEGSYTVKLTVSNSAGADTETRYGYINVEESAALPAADYSVDRRTGEAPLVVKFTDESTGTPTAWKWELGDGYTSNLQNPEHTYEKEGSYTVKLTVSNSAGVDTETKYGYINVEDTPNSPEADFSADRRQDPEHTYEKAGTYAVKLTVSNSAGTDTEIKYGYISVEESTGSLRADFSANRRSGSAPLTVLFKDNSVGDPSAWKWDFGDGYTSTRKAPYHIYKRAGSYAVALTVSNPEGTDTETKYAYITVS